jgi:preprotein translocase subunit SecF
MYVLAGTLFFGFMVLTGLVTYLIFTNKLASIDANMVLLLGSLYGTMSSGFLAVVYYFFGSSKSSSDKSDMLNGKNGAKG